MLFRNGLAGGSWLGERSRVLALLHKRQRGQAAGRLDWMSTAKLLHLRPVWIPLYSLKSWGLSMGGRFSWVNGRTCSPFMDTLDVHGPPAPLRRLIWDQLLLIPQMILQWQPEEQEEGRWGRDHFGAPFHSLCPLSSIRTLLGPPSFSVGFFCLPPQGAGEEEKVPASSSLPRGSGLDGFPGRALGPDRHPRSLCRR